MTLSEKEITTINNLCKNVVKKNSIRNVILNYKDDYTKLSLESSFSLMAHLKKITEDAAKLSIQLPYSCSTCHLILLCCLYTDYNCKGTNIQDNIFDVHYKLRSEIAVYSLKVLFEDMNFMESKKLITAIEAKEVGTDEITSLAAILPSILLSPQELKIRNNLNIMQELAKKPETFQKELIGTKLIVIEELVLYFKRQRSNCR